MSERCMEKMLMLKMQQLEIAESCLEHYSEQSEVFHNLARKAHALYEEMESALHQMKHKHGEVDKDMEARYHRMYHDHHKERAQRIRRELHR